jgi:hypothetical protein
MISCGTEADGVAVYWHPSLLAARSNPSVLNTTSTILAALTGSQEEGYILAESISRGLGFEDKWRLGMGDIHKPWAIVVEVSFKPFTGKRKS